MLIVSADALLPAPARS